MHRMQKICLLLFILLTASSSQLMNYQWKLLGEGYALIQTAKPDPLINEAVNYQGSFIRRVLREVIPFGGVFIK